MTRQETIQCPKCGEMADIQNKYLGGFGNHPVAFCRVDRNHQTPLVWARGWYEPGVYYIQGPHYRIITRREWRLLKAQRECLDESSFLARMEGGEPWEYPPEEPPDVSEYEEEPAQEPAYIAVGMTVEMSKEVL